MFLFSRSLPHIHPSTMLTRYPVANPHGHNEMTDDESIPYKSNKVKARPWQTNDNGERDATICLMKTESATETTIIFINMALFVNFWTVPSFTSPTDTPRVPKSFLLSEEQIKRKASDSVANYFYG